MAKLHEAFHIENLTDLNAFKKEAKARQGKGEETVIHLHARAVACNEQGHIAYLKDGSVKSNA